MLVALLDRLLVLSKLVLKAANIIDSFNLFLASRSQYFTSIEYIPRVRVSHLLDLLFWLGGSRFRKSSKQSFISLLLFLSASLWVTRSSGVLLYGVVLFGESGSSIISVTCRCCKV
jgi:hypothetical protein